MKQTKKPDSFAALTTTQDPGAAGMAKEQCVLFSDSSPCNTGACSCKEVSVVDLRFGLAGGLDFLWPLSVMGPSDWPPCSQEICGMSLSFWFCPDFKYSEAKYQECASVHFLSH